MLAGASGFWCSCAFVSLGRQSLQSCARVGIHADRSRDLITGILSAAAQIAAAFLGVMLAHLVTNTGSSGRDADSDRHRRLDGEFLVWAIRFRDTDPDGAGRRGANPADGALALIAVSLDTIAQLRQSSADVARSLTDSFTAIRLVDAAAIAGDHASRRLPFGYHLWFSPQRDA